MSSIQEFQAAFQKALLLPETSPPNGLTYEFLFTAWEEAGRPQDIDNFLAHGSTIEPDRRNPSHE